MTKWVVGIFGAAMTTVVVAAITGMPTVTLKWLDAHNDGRYLLVADYRNQMFQQELSNYRREADTLEWRRIKAETEEEKEVLEHQMNQLEKDKKDYIEQHRLDRIKTN